MTFPQWMWIIATVCTALGVGMLHAGKRADGDEEKRASTATGWMFVVLGIGFALLAIGNTLTLPPCFHDGSC